MSIVLKTRKRAGNQVHDAASGAIKNISDEKTTAVKFPSRSPQEAWKFSRRCIMLWEGILLILFSCVVEATGAFSWSVGYWCCYDEKVLSIPPPAYSICLQLSILPFKHYQFLHWVEVRLIKFQRYILSRPRAFHEANCSRSLRWRSCIHSRRKSRWSECSRFSLVHCHSQDSYHI